MHFTHVTCRVTHENLSARIDLEDAVLLWMVDDSTDEAEGRAVADFDVGAVWESEGEIVSTTKSVDVVEPAANVVNSVSTAVRTTTEVAVTSGELFSELNYKSSNGITKTTHANAHEKTVKRKKIFSFQNIVGSILLQLLLWGRKREKTRKDVKCSDILATPSAGGSKKWSSAVEVEITRPRETL
jgi:hypothetical protein